MTEKDCEPTQTENEMECDACDPEDLYLLKMGAEWEPHTARSVLDRVRSLMFNGRIKPGYSIERWYWDGGGWMRADDNEPDDE